MKTRTSVWYVVFVILVACLLLSGCKSKKEQPAVSEPDLSQTAAPQAVDPPSLPENPDAVAVLVNDQPITELDVYWAVEMMTRPYPGQVQTAEVREQARQRAVDQLVMRALIAQDAEKSGITVTPEEVDSAFEQIVAQAPSKEVVPE